MAERDVASLITPPGVAAVAVVRMRGPGVGSFLKDHFSGRPAVGRCAYGRLTDNDTTIDDAVVVLTEPSGADLNLHGGVWVVHRVLELLGREGFEVLAPDDAGRLDFAQDGQSILERELLASLPLARTELGVRVLLAQPQAWSSLVRGVKEDPREAAGELSRLRTDQTLRHLLHPPTVAIVGPANVGKSTLANRLFARERSITADLPGTTRDWVGEIANIDGLPVMLVDTPGLRPTEDAIERAAIARSRNEIGRASLVVLVLDVTRPLEGEQDNLLREFPDALRVLNKSDREPVWDRARAGGIQASATIGTGIPDLRRMIVRHFCGSEIAVIERPYVWTDRQRAIIEEAGRRPAAMDRMC